MVKFMCVSRTDNNRDGEDYDGKVVNDFVELGKRPEDM